MAETAEIGLDLVRGLARAALSNLESHRGALNALNVYPVPDGDTGTNLTLTLRAVVEALDEADDADLATLARTAARAALMGARGNSGVILSQIVRGAAGVLERDQSGGAELVTRALRAAADAAYSATLTPVEGTMLTVIREMAEAAEEVGAEEEARLLPEELLRLVVERGEDAVRRTPELLPKLRDAGVVDAGGLGLVEILRGIQLSLAGLPLPERADDDEGAVPPLDHEFSAYAFCTNFVVEGEAINRDDLCQALGPLGDSLHVVGDAALVRVHVHTDRPTDAVEVAGRFGRVVTGTLDTADMHHQVREQLRKTGTLLTALVAVAPGDGNARLLERVFGEVRVVRGAAAANPSALELAEAANATLADAVVLLPNDGNVAAAARQALVLVTKPARVVATRSLQQGLHLATAVYDHAAGLDANAEAFERALPRVRSGAMTRASRGAILDGVTVAADDWLGLVDERAVAAGPVFEPVAIAVCEALLEEGADALTLVLGEEPPALRALLDEVGRLAPRVEVECRDGGQPHYGLLLFAEAPERALESPPKTAVGASASGVPTGVAAGGTLTVANTAVVLDSTSDWREDRARPLHPNLRVVPLGITFETDKGERSYRDHLDIYGHAFYEELRRWPARTNAPFPGDFESVYRELLPSYEHVWSLHLSSKLSATWANAKRQAGETGAGRIRAVDTGSASLAVALLAQAVERRLVRGTTEAELDALVARFRREHGVVFTVATLEYLRRGGRIGKAQALMGSLLSVKPILSVADGEITPVGKARGHRRALEELVRQFRDATPDAPGLRLAIAHADEPAWVDEILALAFAVRPQADRDVLVAELGAAVGAHAGPGSVGFFWFHDP